MSQRQLKLGLAAFVALAIGVVANLLMLQSGPRVAKARSAGELQAKIAQDRERSLALAVPRQNAPAATSARQSTAIDPAAIAGATGGADHADTIRAVQRELKQRGYLATAPDGVAGLVTRAAIMAYEHDNSLPVTAEPSEALLKQIVLGIAPPRGQPAAAGVKSGQPELITRTVQQSLSGLGYNTGRVDGHLGEETQRAIRDFESDNSMPETGRISGQLVAKLGRLAGNGRLTASR